MWPCRTDRTAVKDPASDGARPKANELVRLLKAHGYTAAWRWVRHLPLEGEEARQRPGSGEASPGEGASSAGRLQAGGGHSPSLPPAPQACRCPGQLLRHACGSGEHAPKDGCPRIMPPAAAWTTSSALAYGARVRPSTLAIKTDFFILFYFIT
jgi:hypothetical protein